MRNAPKFVYWKDRKGGTADLKKIDRALTAEDIEQALLTRIEIRDREYAILGQIRTRYWPNLITLFDDSEDIRKVMHTINAIESLNSVSRKDVKTARCFHRTRRF